MAADAIAAAVAGVCAEHGVQRLGVPPALPGAWRPAGVDVVEDHGLTPAELDTLDAALTGCTLAIADTGSLVLAAGPADGRRALSLVPDVFLCVVHEDQIEPDLPAAMPRIAGVVRRLRPPRGLRLRPVRHVRHRAAARGGGARPPAARGAAGRSRLSASARAAERRSPSRG